MVRDLAHNDTSRLAQRLGGGNGRGTVEWMDADPIVDWQAVSRMVPGGAPVVRELVAIMVAECPRMIDMVRRGIAEDDASLVRRGAHTLRGAARHFGARRVIDAAGDMEELAVAGDLRAARDALPRLEAAALALTAALADPKLEGS
jgi:HPt (histidine-containing phosphotransfer) domain-containing protein